MIDYQCDICKKYKAVDRSKIEIGDDVNFTTKVSTSRSIRLTSKSGTVVARDGDALMVNSNSKLYNLHISEVTPEDAPNNLTYALFGICDCEASVENSRSDSDLDTEEH